MPGKESVPWWFKGYLLFSNIYDINKQIEKDI